ncbi:tetratricopeptide repeat protein [Streptomyces sp. NPDC001732]
MAALLLLLAAVLTIVGLTTDHGLVTQVSRLLWALGILLIVRNTVLGRRGMSPEALTAAADAGDPGALRFLAMKAKARGELEESERLLHRAVEAGDLDALRALAMTAKIHGELEEAERLLRRAVEAGDVESMWEMGRLVENRDGLPPSEPWFRMAAEHGHVVARQMFEPGDLFNRNGDNPL